MTSPSNPFKIGGPALISFSGGRTSGYMLREIIQAHGGVLPSDVRVTFANTGREMPETLDFVRNCGERFGADIVWLEYQDGEHGQRWHSVDYDRASRDGEPFAALIGRKKYAPNVVARFCTQELKIRPMRDYARSLGWEHWTNVVGLRADERFRVASLRSGAERERWDVETPLATAGITKADIAAFWARQNFDLELPNVNGTTPLGNCDLCFLKSEATLAGIARQYPRRVKWWADMEARTGTTFSKRFRHTDLVAVATRADLFDALSDVNVGDCYCTGDS